MTDLPDPAPRGAAAATPSVRHARPEDVDGLVRAQAAAWRAAYADLLPAVLLDGLDGPEARAAWADAVATQAERRHVLVATDGGRVVGLATLTGASDPDLDPAVDAELGVLAVDPAHARSGHGSRLLAAAADLLREDGFTHAFCWVATTDDALRALLVTSGWAADGARRSLAGEAAAEVHQLRLLTAL